MYNIHCQWHPLKKCIVGRTYYSNFFADIPAADALAKVCEETEEDLQNLVGILHHFNVEVIRPNLDINDKFINYVNVPRPPIAPRDSLIVIDNKIYEFGLDHPSIKKCINDDVKSCPFTRHRKTTFNLATPSITQLGKDILIDTKCFTSWEIQWLQKQLPTHRINTISIGGHNDGSFIILKPGVILSLSKTVDWKTFFSNWDVMEIDSDENEWFTERKTNQATWWIPGQENNNALKDFVNKWLNDWVGNISETVFSINALIIDEKHVVINTPRQDVINFLKKHDIEAIVCPQRHQYFWDNGIHCMTLDLYREGELFDLFPTRETPFMCNGY